MDHHYQIYYENVYLRPLEEADIENLRIWRNDPRNSAFLSKQPYITPQMQREWFNKYRIDDDEICFAIVETCELNRTVGSLCLYDFSEDSCFFGKILVGDEDAHGRKVGLNATLAATKIAFEQLKTREVKLCVYAENIGAFKVYKQAGFRIINEHYSLSGMKEYTMIRKLEDK